MDILKEPFDSLRDELDALNRDWRDIEGSPLSATQCYHFESNPPHFLFNVNCPASLEQKLKDLLTKYFPENENRLSQ